MAAFALVIVVDNNDEEGAFEHIAGVLAETTHVAFIGTPWEVDVADAHSTDALIEQFTS